jgi:hypothetical protein
MKKANENKIFKKYPKLFPGGRNVDKKKSLMYWGICCNDGWYDLIDKLCADLRQMIDKESLEGIQVEQVKEKFGGLRFYINCGTTQIFSLIHKAEAKSFKITLCKPCEKKALKAKMKRLGIK